METETFPLPPPGTGEYVWVASEALQSLRTSALALQTALVGCDVSGANATVVAEGKKAFSKSAWMRVLRHDWYRVQQTACLSGDEQSKPSKTSSSARTLPTGTLQCQLLRKRPGS